MIEYRIVTPATLKFIRRLWKLFFQKDKTWHYTLEGNYVEVRVSKGRQDLEKYLADEKLEYTRFVYEDAVPITRKYQKYFEQIFHGYSELAMHTRGLKDGCNYFWREEKLEEVPQVLERAVHLLFDIFNANGEMEAYWLSRYAVGRAIVAGAWKEKLRQWQEQKSENKSKKEKTKKLNA